jgi:hypothetical protein
MTPKEKASNLVDNFLDLDNYNNLNLDLFCDECGMSNEAAKICALIAVEEVRNFHYKLFFASKGSLLDQYLDKVKIEIEKL